MNQKKLGEGCHRVYSPGPANQNEKSAHMLKNLIGCSTLADDGGKEEEEEDEEEGEQVDEVLLADVPPHLQFHLAQLLPQLP